MLSIWFVCILIYICSPTCDSCTLSISIWIYSFLSLLCVSSSSAPWWRTSPYTSRVWTIVRRDPRLVTSEVKSRATCLLPVSLPVCLSVCLSLILFFLCVCLSVYPVNDGDWLTILCHDRSISLLFSVLDIFLNCIIALCLCVAQRYCTSCHASYPWPTGSTTRRRKPEAHSVSTQSLLWAAMAISMVPLVTRVA